MKYSILTFGCRVNQADSLVLEQKLRTRGAEPTSSAEADLVLVNSCSVTCSADQGTRQAIRRVARENPSAQIVVTGCYATRSPEQVAAIPGVLHVVANRDKDTLVEWLAGSLSGLQMPTTAERFGRGEGPCGAVLRPGDGGRTSLMLRVQTGCDEKCSYCIIPSTRGSSVSRPLGSVLRNVEQACEAGYREITLTGVHLGAYGRDLRPRRSLSELLGALARMPHDLLIRLGSLEPMDCTEEVLSTLAGSPKFADALHLPLQHAAGRVLEAMRRPYSLEYYAGLVGSIRRRLPAASIGTDIIVGFPGESDREFDELRSYLERSPLTQLHVFPYSDRPGTEASKLPSKVVAAVVRERARSIREIGRRLTSRFLDTQVLRVHRALTIDDGTLVVTGNGLKARLITPLPRNEWVDVRLRRGGETLVADLLRG